MRLATLALLLFCVHAMADGPSWAGRSSFEDNESHYFVGRGQGPTEAQAFAEARNDAIETAIRELFGFSTRIYNRASETTQATSYQSTKAELSKSVQFQNLKEHKSQSSKSDGVYQVWVQYRYSKADARIEYERLAKVPDNVEVPIGMVQMQTSEGLVSLPAKGTYKKSDLPPLEQMYLDFKGYKNSVTLSLMGLEYQRQLHEQFGIKVGLSPGSLIDKHPPSSDSRYGNSFSYDLDLGICLRTEELGNPLFAFLSLFGGPTKFRSESKFYSHYGYELGAQFVLGSRYGITTSYLQKFGSSKGPYLNAYDGIFNFGLVFNW